MTNEIKTIEKEREELNIMIIFKGNISGNTKKFMINKIKQTSFISMLFPCIPIGVLMLILTLRSDWIFSIGLFVCVLIPFITLLPPSQRTLKSITPIQIIINGNAITSIGENFKYTNELSNIKKVLDYGEWYCFSFKYTYRNPTFVCQKDLLTEGTIEEFESLFKDKIVKK